MKSQNKIVIVAILTIAVFTLINLNDTTRAAAPNKPTRVAPADDEVFLARDTITLESSPFYDPDVESGDDGHYQTHWEVWRYDTEMPVDGYPLVLYDDLESHVLGAQLQEGLRYGWRVGYEDYYNNVTYSDDFFFTVGNSIPEALPTIAAGTSLSDFGMESISLWPNSPDPKDVFGISYDPNEYRIGTWDPEKNQYIEFGKGLTIEPGRAYWVLARHGLDVVINGVPVSMVEDIEVCLHTHSSTGMGWNMIAPPNKANYLWNDVQVGSLEYPEEVAIGDPSRLADRVINHRIWEW